MKAWIIIKVRQENNMYMPGSWRIVEGHETQEIAYFVRDSMIKQMSEAERRVGWTYLAEATEIHMSPTATAESKPVVD